MFSKYLDQMIAMREKTIILLDDLRNYQDRRYKAYFAHLVCDFNNLNTCLNSELQIYDQRLPYLNSYLLIYYLRHNNLNQATKLVNQWYDEIQEMIYYYTSLDCSKAVLFLECALTVYTKSLDILLGIKNFYEWKKIAA